jgi:hypothetical protein
MQQDGIMENTNWVNIPDDLKAEIMQLKDNKNT